MSIVRSLASLSFVGLAAMLAACTAGTSDGAKSNAGADSTGTCDASGTWAIRVDTPVSWTGSFVVQGGTGTITNWLKSTRTVDGSLNVTDVASLCGVSTPDYTGATALGGEHYGVTFPDALFSSGTLPTFQITGTLSGTDPGATFQANPASALLGATMANPATDPWPSNSAQLTVADTDADNNPGITVNSATGGTYKDPPLDAFKSARATKIYTAFRQVITTQGTISTCDRVDGTGTVATINNKPAIDQHVLGCVTEAGAACNASQFKLLDSAAPVYKPTGDATVVMVRIPDTATCDDIRAMDFTAQAAPPAAGQ